MRNDGAQSLYRRIPSIPQAVREEYLCTVHVVTDCVDRRLRVDYQVCINNDQPYTKLPTFNSMELAKAAAELVFL